jgi:cytoskeletal protein CcmA (bactofilin family)
MVRRLLIFVGLLLLVAAAPAQAKDDDRVVIHGPVEIGPGQTAGDVIVAHGDVTVAARGRVTGDLIVASGDVRVAGSVEGDLVSLADRAVLGPRARVGGDLFYGDDKPVIPPGATVEGDVERVHIDEGLGFAAGLAIWLGITISALLLGLMLLWLFPRAAAAVYETARERLGAAFGFGLLAFIVLPIVAVLLLVTVVGLPLGLLLLLALAPIYALAYTVAAYALGQRILGPERGRFVAFLAGLAILRVLAIVPVLGGIVWFAATVFGLGLLVRTARRGRRGTPRAAEPTPAPA